MWKVTMRRMFDSVTGQQFARLRFYDERRVFTRDFTSIEPSDATVADFAARVILATDQADGLWDALPSESEVQPAIIPDVERTPVEIAKVDMDVAMEALRQIKEQVSLNAKLAGDAEVSDAEVNAKLKIQAYEDALAAVKSARAKAIENGK